MPDIERGRRLVEAGERRPLGLVDSFDVLAYYESEQERVLQRGECSGGCAGTDLIPHHAKRDLMVCPRTNKPCARRRLAKLLDLYGEVNR